MKTIYKGIIATASITVPAATTVGIVYGTKDADNTIHIAKAITPGEKFFDKVIAGSNNSYVSSHLISPSRGYNLSELTRLDNLLDSKHAVKQIKKDANGKINSLVDYNIDMNNIIKMSMLDDQLREINEKIQRFTNKSKFKTPENGLSKIGIYIGKDLVKRRIIISLYELKDVSSSLKTLADEFMDDLGTIDQSRIDFSGTQGTSFFEVYASENTFYDRALKEYYKFGFKNGLDANGFITKWGFSLKEFEKNNKIELKAANLNINNVAKLPLNANNKIELNFWDRLEITENNVKKRVMVTTKPVYDNLTGEMKVFINFYVINDETQFSIDNTDKYFNYESKYTCIKSFNTSTKFGTTAAIANKATEITNFRNVLTGSIKDYINRPLIKSGIGIMTTVVPKLGSDLSGLIESMSLLNMANYKDILTDQFINKLFKALEDNKYTDANKFIGFLNSFDPDYWSNINNLTNLRPDNGGQYGLFVLASGFRVINQMILDEILLNHPEAKLSFTGPIIDEVIDELIKINALDSATTINKILSDPLGFVKELIKNLSEKKIDIPKKVIAKLVPLIPMASVQANALGFTDGIASIIGDHSKIDMFLDGMIKGNDKLMDDWIKIYLTKHPSYKSHLTDAEKILEIKKDKILSREILIDNIITSKMFALDLSSNDENILTVALRGKYPIQLIKDLGIATAKTGILPAFLNSIIPDTYMSAGTFYNLFNNGLMIETYHFIQEIHQKGLIQLNKVPSTGGKSPFETKISALADKLLNSLDISSLLPDGVNVGPIVTKNIVMNNVIPVITQIFNTPVKDWDQLVSANSEIGKLLTAIKNILPSSSTASIDDAKDLFDKFVGVLSNGIQPSIASATDLDNILNNPILKGLLGNKLSDEMLDGIKGFLYGFKGDYNRFAKFLNSIKSGLADMDLSTAGILSDFTKKLIQGGSLSTGLFHPINSAVVALLGGTGGWDAIQKILRNGLLSARKADIDKLVDVLQHVMTHQISTYGFSIGTIGSLVSIPHNIGDLLNSLKHTEDAEAIYDVLHKPISAVKPNSFNEIIRIVTGFLNKNLVHAGSALNNLLNNGFKSLSLEETSSLAKLVETFIGGDSMHDTIMNFLYGNENIVKAGAQLKTDFANIKAAILALQIPTLENYAVPSTAHIEDPSGLKVELASLEAKFTATTDPTELSKLIVDAKALQARFNNVKSAYITANAKGLAKVNAFNTARTAHGGESTTIVVATDPAANAPHAKAVKLVANYNRLIDPNYDASTHTYQENIDAINLLNTFSAKLTSINSEISASNAGVVIPDAQWNALIGAQINGHSVTSYDASTGKLTIHSAAKDGSGWFASYLFENMRTLTLGGIHFAVSNGKIIAYTGAKPTGAKDISGKSFIKDQWGSSGYKDIRIKFDSARNVVSAEYNNGGWKPLSVSDLVLV